MATPLQAPLKTLLLGFDSLPAQKESDCVMFARALVAPELTSYANKGWLFEQSFAPYALVLKEQGYDVRAAQEEKSASMDYWLYLATRSNEENQHEIARGWNALKPGGWMLAAQHNDLGGKRLESTLKQLTGAIVSTSKHHCRAVAVQKTGKESAEVKALLVQWQKAADAQIVPGTPLMAAPGMFSWRKVDAGSKFLIETLPASLSGRGADICAGWGYLSWAALERCKGIAHIALVEAEKRALDMAEKNLSSIKDKCSFHWSDATRTLPVNGLDWAMMNPPAHDLMLSAPDASAAIFATAAKALKSGGSLWLVANRHLPYERTLSSLFSSVRTATENADFKVLEAVR